MIYFDNAATTYPKPEAVYTFAESIMRSCFNAGRGTYEPSVKIHKAINDARKAISNFANCEAENVIFTSSATEASNMIVNGINLEEGDHVYVSPFEHNAIVRPLHSKKVNIHIIPFDKETWDVEIDKLNDLFAINNPKAIFLSQISNVTGYELPYSKIFELASKYNPIKVLDAAQGFGLLKIKTNFIDYILFAGHKSLYGIFGVGGFIKLGKDNLIPTKFGGTGSDSLNYEMPIQMPERYEAGSNNPIAICSLNESVKWLIENDIVDKEYELTSYLVDKLRLLEKITIYLPKNKKTFGIVSISVKGYNSDDVSEILYDEFNICVRSGYHCAPLIHDFINSKDTGGTVRISLGAFNTKEQVDILCNALESL